MREAIAEERQYLAQGEAVPAFIQLKKQRVQRQLEELSAMDLQSFSAGEPSNSSGAQEQETVGNTSAGSQEGGEAGSD